MSIFDLICTEEVERVEEVVEMVEKVAEDVEKVADDIGDHLPEGTKLRKAASFVENVAEETVKDANQVEQFIDKVFSFILPNPPVFFLVENATLILFFPSNLVISL